MTQTTLTGEKHKTILKGACDKYHDGQRCGGNLIEHGKQLDPDNPDQFVCQSCHRVTIIQGLVV